MPAQPPPSRRPRRFGGNRPEVCRFPCRSFRKVPFFPGNSHTAASLEYNSLSPVYYGRTTTDTYYPHLFVELGLVGGAWFLGMLLLPWLTFRNRETLVPYAILCLYLFADSLASFLMHSLDAMPITALLFGIAGMSTVRSSEGGRGLLGGPNASRRSIPHMVETARAARSPRVA